MHLDNLLFILLIAMAVLFRLLASKASDAKKRPQQPAQRSTTPPHPVEPVKRAPVESDEERIRRFLEALGQPATAKPPPPVAPRPTYQKPVVLPQAPPSSPLPPLTTRTSDLPRKIRLPGQLIPTYETKKFTPKVAEVPAFEVHEGALPPEPPPIIKTPAEAYAIATQPVSNLEQPKTDIAVLLKSTSGLRNAIILREIFGPPRGLQALDLVGSA